MLERVASIVEPTLTQIPPNVLRPGLGDLMNMGKMGRSMQKLGPAMSEAMEILTGAARPILDRWFESEQLKGTIATDAIIGAFMAPSMPGTAYVLIPSRHGRNERQARRLGVHARRHGRAYAVPGSGRSKTSASKSTRNAEVTKILTSNGAVTGVALKNGDEFRAKKRRERRRHAPDL